MTKVITSPGRVYTQNGSENNLQKKGMHIGRAKQVLISSDSGLKMEKPSYVKEFVVSRAWILLLLLIVSL